MSTKPKRPSAPPGCEEAETAERATAILPGAEPPTRQVHSHTTRVQGGTRKGLGSQPVPARPIEPEQTVRSAWQRGSTLDRYVVIDVIGEGGMGTVLRAFDPDLDRSVAIKVLLPATTKGKRKVARTRLLREAQAMARISHPNVVTVFDVGTVEGRVFVAMELAQSSLKEWLAAEERPWRQILDAYVQAGRGLAEAHRAGLVHRDFKPANVLVARSGAMCVTDFGLVAAAPDGLLAAEASSGVPQTPVDERSGSASRSDHPSESDLGSRGSTPMDQQLTRSGVIMGTPAYMAPEQHCAQPTDSRADQFSFCVSLYRGLYQRRPFPGRGLDQLRASVLQGKLGSPPADSPVPPWVWQALQRGLAVRPEDRFASLDELLAALESDPSRKQARDLTLEALVKLGSAKADDGDVEAGERALREALARAIQAGDETHEAEAWLRLFVVIGAQPGRAKEGLALSDQAAAVIDRAGGDPWQLARLHSWRGRLLEGLNRYADCHAECELAIEYTGQAGRDNDYTTAISYNNLGDVLYMLDREQEALAAYGRALHIAEHSSGPNGPEAASAVRGTAVTLRSLGRLEESLPLFERALSLQDRMDQPVVWMLEQLNRQHGLALVDLGRLREALSPLESNVALCDEHMPESQEAALAHHHLTALQSDLGLWDEARQQARISLRLADSNEDLGPNLRASLYDVVGRVQDCSGDAARALITFRKAQAIRNDALEPQSVDVALSHNNVAAALSSLTRWDEAGREYAQALRIVEILGGPESPETGVVIGNLGTCYRWQGRFDEAIDHYRRALPMLQSGKGEYRRRLGPLLHDLGEAHYLRGEFDEALARFREARSEYEEVLGSDHDRVAAALTAIGNCFVALRDHARALPHYERALALRAAPSTAPGPLGESRFGLAIALFYSGTDRSRALRLAAEALEDFRRAGPLGEGNLTQVREWLAQQQGDDLTLN